jgi:hypothetical protein
MKSGFLKLLIGLTVFVSSANSFTSQEEEVTLVCVKKHNASNTCHYNFTISGVNYRFVDMGCKAKRDDVLKRAQKGELGLAKDWKIVCPGSTKPS